MHAHALRKESLTQSCSFRARQEYLYTGEAPECLKASHTPTGMGFGLRGGGSSVGAFAAGFAATTSLPSGPQSGDTKGDLDISLDPHTEQGEQKLYLVLELLSVGGKEGEARLCAHTL